MECTKKHTLYAPLFALFPHSPTLEAAPSSSVVQSYTTLDPGVRFMVIEPSFHNFGSSILTQRTIDRIVVLANTLMSHRQNVPDLSAVLVLAQP